MTGLRLIRLLLIAGMLAAGAPPSFAADPTLVVIASPGSSRHRLSRDAVARIFLRRQSQWDSGLRIQPANLPATSVLRRQFSLSVLGSAPEAFEDYWRDMYFHGVVPPHVLASEEAMTLFVEATPGAIGYVSTCPVGRHLDIVLVIGAVPDCQN